MGRTASRKTGLARELASRTIPWDRSAGERIGELATEARFILIGEASHGTHEFYDDRAAITRALIETGRCDAVAVEADWPDASRVNRYVLGRGEDRTAEEALGDFGRFPQWMWRNTDVVRFIEWLRTFNSIRPVDRRVGFHGLDLYSLYASIEAVIAYLDKVDPTAGRSARARYACFEEHGEDPQRYGAAASIGEKCEDEAVMQLIELLSRRESYLARDGVLAQDEQFFAEQNARLVKNAERYYRAMFGRRLNTWNLRDQHMAETLEALCKHLAARMAEPAIVVWAHNSHLGDARATEMSERGELNLGQLVREKHGEQAFNIGFTTFDGTVAAASDWGEAVELMKVRPALAGSIEALMHDTGRPNFMLDLRDTDVRELLHERRLERAIGVIYRPQTERFSHYFYAHVPAQFDLLIHRDRTRAVHPLERTPAWDVPEPEEGTFPSGI